MLMSLAAQRPHCQQWGGLPVTPTPRLPLPTSLPPPTLCSFLLRFVPTVGVVFVLCMRAVTCKNGRRRVYFGSCLHLGSAFPQLLSHFPLLLPALTLLLARTVWHCRHCGQRMLHIISFITRAKETEKSKKKKNKKGNHRFESNRQQSSLAFF